MDSRSERLHTITYWPEAWIDEQWIDEQPMKVIGRPLAWAIVAIVVYLLWRAPQPMSAVLGGIGHIFAAIGHGFAVFLSKLTGKPL
jgi:hypothetical protein